MVLSDWSYSLEQTDRTVTAKLTTQTKKKKKINQMVREVERGSLRCAFKGA